MLQPTPSSCCASHRPCRPPVPRYPLSAPPAPAPLTPHAPPGPSRAGQPERSTTAAPLSARPSQPASSARRPAAASAGARPSRRQPVRRPRRVGRRAAHSAPAGIHLGQRSCSRPTRNAHSQHTASLARRTLPAAPKQPSRPRSDAPLPPTRRYDLLVRASSGWVHVRDRQGVGELVRALRVTPTDPIATRQRPRV